MSKPELLDIELTALAEAIDHGSDAVIATLARKLVPALVRELRGLRTQAGAYKTLVRSLDARLAERQPSPESEAGRLAADHRRASDAICEALAEADAPQAGATRMGESWWQPVAARIAHLGKRYAYVRRENGALRDRLGHEREALIGLLDAWSREQPDAAIVPGAAARGTFLRVVADRLRVARQANDEREGGMEVGVGPLARP